MRGPRRSTLERGCSVAILDDNDPIVILCNRFNELLDKHDSHTAFAALSFTLGAMIALSASKGPLAPALAMLREDLLALSTEAVRARESERES